MMLPEIKPNECYSAYLDQEKLRKDKRLAELKEEERIFNIQFMNYIKEINPLLEKGFVPVAKTFYDKKMVKKVAKYYTDNGWFCFTYGTGQYTISNYHLNIDFPGPITKLWRKFINFFFNFFVKNKILPVKETVYRD